MAATRIATTRAQDLTALGTAGQLAVESWGALNSLLARELSADHANLLAEPANNPTRGEIDWYAEGDGSAAPMASLNDADRAALQARLDALVGDCLALAQRLKAGRTDGDRFLGEMLTLALEIPGPDFVYSRGGKPVLVGWGHVRTGPTAERATLTGRLVREPEPMRILPPPDSPYAWRKPPTAWGLLLTALLAGLLLVGAAVFVLLRDPLGWFSIDVAACQIAPGQLALMQSLRDEAGREGALQLELGRLMTDAGQRRLQCPAPPAAPRQTPVPPQPTPSQPTPPPQTPPPAPAPPNSDASRADREGSHRGKLQIILAWDDRNDLDLHIVCPNRAEIFYMRRRACGGTLDHDANGDTNNLTDMPVETAFFDQPPPGRIRIIVDPYAMRVRPTSPFRVTIRREGQPDQVITGTAQSGRHNVVVTEIEVTE